MTARLTASLPVAATLLALVALSATGCGGNTADTPANPIQRPANLKVEAPGGGKPQNKWSRASGPVTKPGSLTD